MLVTVARWAVRMLRPGEDDVTGRCKEEEEEATPPRCICLDRRVGRLRGVIAQADDTREV